MPNEAKGRKKVVFASPSDPKYSTSVLGVMEGPDFRALFCPYKPLGDVGLCNKFCAAFVVRNNQVHCNLVGLIGDLDLKKKKEEEKDAE